MKPDMSKNTAISDIPSPSFLTPTTLKNITQILESEECMKGIQTFEETGNADKAIAVIEAKEKPKTRASSNIKIRSGNTYFSLDSKSWQVGLNLFNSYRLLYHKFICYSEYKFILESNLKHKY